MGGSTPLLRPRGNRYSDTSGGNAKWASFYRGVGQICNKTVYLFTFDPVTLISGIYPKQLPQPYENIFVETYSIEQAMAFFVITNFRKRAECPHLGGVLDEQETEENDAATDRRRVARS